MQLRTPLSIAAILLIAASAQAEDYVSVQYLQYMENDDRTTVSAPSVELNKAFGTDVELNLGFVYDAVSGASPTFYDGASGASAYSRGSTSAQNVRYGNISYEEQRTAYSGLLTYRLPNRDELKVGGNYSTEHDFDSFEGSAEYMHWMDSAKSRSLSFGVSYQYNEITVRDTSLQERMYSARDNDGEDGESGASRMMDANTLNLQLGFSQVLNENSYVKAALFYISESGYLTNPYLNVVRNYNTAPQISGESRPDSKSASGVSLRYITALGENAALHVGYRYYMDDWNINSHTADMQLYYNVGEAITLGLKGRFYNQSAADFYSGEVDYFTNERYASSDKRLSAFDALSYGAEFTYHFSKELSYNLGVTYYDQSTNLSALYVGTGFTYHF